MITLESFVVQKKLSVKNIRVKPKVIKAEYCVENFSGVSQSYDLIYSYENSCFDVKNGQDINLACMTLSQVALNYGLFFQNIEFDGLFDKSDQKFITDMMENTSREILINKLLIQNEFILPPYNQLQADRRKRYTQASLSFINTAFSDKVIINKGQVADISKYAILSSGGKDSLLSYGLINEIGKAYPVFINEAGRHWFTALNAHRYFKENEPETLKPWSNCDRLFSWMLKQLPFIKKNYASIRSDIYPVRLWTVAVFLFGVLPIVRKKNIGNILIGNEYDTTMPAIRHGISHYNGLYDQSKYFDNALTRYYENKGWSVKQFSILRSMSELLIMKTLIKRYPHLQEQQISCHAAHRSADRMYPCGKCEKCRRIIGMIKALDENPEKCGYTERQIIWGLQALEKKSVKQLGSDAAHLYYLLMERGLIIKNKHTAKLAKVHPEISKLRFDKGRSNLEDLPSYIRKPLFDILVKYADGAIMRRDRKWQLIKTDQKFLTSTKYKMDKI